MRLEKLGGPLLEDGNGIKAFDKSVSFPHRLPIMMWLTLFRAATLLLFAQVAVSVTTFTNPIKNPNGSDPFMVYDGGYYYLLTTTWTNVQVRATS